MLTGDVGGKGGAIGFTPLFLYLLVLASNVPVVSKSFTAILDPLIFAITKELSFCVIVLGVLKA